MDLMGLLEILLALLCFIIVRHLRSNSHDLPTNWPLIGMLPALLSQVLRVHDWITEILAHNAICNFLFRGPWFCDMDMLITVDPANIHYIMSANFVNFPKGSEFKKIFDVLGDGIFNADYELWKDQRRVAVSLVNHREFHRFLARTSQDKIQNGLIPILDRASTEGLVVDLQDLFQRFTFDSICKLVTGFEPACLSSDYPEVPFAKALDEAEEAIFFRHVFPKFLWKLQRWIGIGEEKKLSEAWKCFDRIIGKYIEKKREELRKGEESTSKEESFDLLTSYMNMEKDDISGLDCNNDKFLRDTILNLVLAGRDTTTSALTWFFWNLSKHPSVEIKIREEINSLAMEEEEMLEGGECINKLVYLHGAICESLRLYPPVPFQHKSPIKPNVLPSGHSVKARSRILFSLYAMGRMPSIWGEDCSEFRPERWISDKGTIRHEPSYKFLTFNAGPRTCLGKEVAFIQMKTVLATIIRNFHVQVEEGQDVRPRASIILHMKHGLKARISRISGY
ncbi:alkane hydroxylase MAH1-like [Punica granatum]|uniref:Uncharacterized protein n=2 Tax=Punica granatum TaxID=22663 RepID=A0A218VYW3_PUNGR|nr:alkane hydroxylase MAH1-like [Punica granatum]OWM65596.1 hypothetical protein CDL15_Pgr017093 [Punica granatum]PKI33438.1 hypothetical protein CRG98_046169 [Punica granatum]